MNIEQKNTLFIISLVLAVLVGVAGVGYLLIAEHVHEEMTEDLDRAQRVFTEVQKNDFERLVTSAKGIAKEPALIAAALTGDMPTMRGMLEDLFSRPRVDLLAIHMGTGPSGVLGEGSKPHFTSPQVLSSEPMLKLVRQLTRGGQSDAFANLVIYDTLLRLVAVPIENPLGGRIGVLIIGEEINQAAAVRLSQLLRAEVMIFTGNVVFGATAPLGTSVPEVVRAKAGDGKVLSFTVGDTLFNARVYPMLSGDGAEVAARALLANDDAKHWGAYELLARNAGYFATLIMLFAALIGIAISRAMLTRPIKRLAEATRAIGAGDLDVTVQESRGDELGELAHSFNQMLAQIKHSHDEIRHSGQRFHDFANSSSDWLWETDAEARYSYVSPGISATLEYQPDELLGRSIAEVFTEDNVSPLMALLKPTGAAQGFKDIELWITAREGQARCLTVSGIPLLVDGRFSGFRGTAKDNTSAKRDEEKLMYLANQDHLTGLANRRRFMDELTREIRRSERRKTTGALLLLDLDHFKLINDTAGHAAGDEVIVQLATLLKRLSRSEDIVARLSGDEFAMTFPDMDVTQALAKGQQILEHIATLKPRQGGKVRNISASIGAVIFPDHGNDPVELLAKADTAMYGAKNAGRNRCQLFSAGDRTLERMGSQLTWKERIHQALEEDLFVLAFQPIAGTDGRAATHFEVLVRMKDARGAIHMPGNFIPTAEQFGLIREVDKVIVRKAIRELARHPISDNAVGFSINLSGLSVGDPNMLELIEKEIEETGIFPERLTFEVTETVACENMNRAIEFIARIRELGCKVSLDDFGVGFSSFSYLKHLRVDKLKIDGSFIRNIATSREDQLFVKALVDVARGLGLQTVAEFVESEAALDIVRALGVDYAQGYFVGRPTASLLHEVTYQKKTA